MNYDLRDTVAGMQIYEEGFKYGLKKGNRKIVKDMVIDVLIERFVVVPAEVRESVYSVERHEELKELHRYAIRSPDIEDFEKVLSKVLSAPKKSEEH